MAWFYNSISGELGKHDGIDALAYEAALHSGTGWHELHIADSATFAQAATEAKKEVPGGQTPTGSQTKGLQQAPGGVAQEVFHGLNVSNVILRIGEVILGVVLIGVGIAKITGSDNIISSAAKVAGAAAIL